MSSNLISMIFYFHFQFHFKSFLILKVIQFPFHQKNIFQTDSYLVASQWILYQAVHDDFINIQIFKLLCWLLYFLNIWTNN